MVSKNDIEEDLPATLEAASKTWVKGRIKSLHDELEDIVLHNKDENIVLAAEADEKKVDATVNATTTATATTTVNTTATATVIAVTALPVEATAVEAETTMIPSLGYDLEEVENAGSLQLPSSRINGNRSITAVCTICLCPYENGEYVCWSPDRKCQHAFHKDCIIAWLAKKDEPKCPICRQDFCVLHDVPAMVVEPEMQQQQQLQQQMAVPYSFSQSLSRALALSRLEAAAMEQQQQQHQSNSNSNNNTINASNSRSNSSSSNNGGRIVRFSSAAIRNQVADEEMMGGGVTTAIDMATAETVPSQDDVYGGRAGFGTGAGAVTPAADDNV